MGIKLREFVEDLDFIESHPSSHDKTERLRGMIDNPFFQATARMTFDSEITFGVRVDIPEKGEYPNYEEIEKIDDANALLDYINICTDLSERKITGNEAREAVEMYLSNLPTRARYYFSLFMNKKFVAGIGQVQMYKIVPEAVNIFTYQKCDDFMILHPTNSSKDKRKKHYDLVINDEVPQWVIQPKFDGFRGIFIPDDNGDYRVYSSSGSLYNNCESICAELKAINLPLIYDGELIADNWNNTASILTSEFAHPEASTLNFKIFSLINADQWDEGEGMVEDTNQQALKYLITKLDANPTDFGQFKSGRLFLVLGYPVKTEEDIKAFARAFYKSGYEGAVIKKLSGQYMRWSVGRSGLRQVNRSANWLKIKFEDTSDYKITGVVFSDDPSISYNVKYGGYMVESITLDVNGVEVQCGSMTFEDRVFYTINHAHVIGNYAEVRFQKDSEQFSTQALRYPSHLRYRGDKIGEE